LEKFAYEVDAGARAGRAIVCKLLQEQRRGGGVGWDRWGAGPRLLPLLPL